MEFVHVNAADIPARDAYSLLLNCVAPRPIAFVSSMSPNGDHNLAPFSFFTAGGANPPSVVFSPTSTRSGEPKDTLQNIRALGEYVINVVTYAMGEAMNVTSVEYPYGVSEWDIAGFTPAPCVNVSVPRVMESPLAMECKLFQIVPHGAGHMAATYVIGEVVAFHIAEYLLDGATIVPSRVEYIARMSGDWYARANEGSMFEMARPPRPVE